MEEGVDRCDASNTDVREMNLAQSRALQECELRFYLVSLSKDEKSRILVDLGLKSETDLSSIDGHALAQLNTKLREKFRSSP